NSFSPACDAILDASQFQRLPQFIRFAKMGMKIIIISFAISFLYNFIGLSFAVQGTLSPLISAVLMPLSSISVIVFATGATRLMARFVGMSNGRGKMSGDW
ncbi:MAG: heavy metal translocating P-type ATPase, partial [Calditrichia bacterium]